MRTSHAPVFLLPWVLAAACMGMPAWAQVKVVGPDGKVTYSDKPVAGSSTQRATPVASDSPAEAGAVASLPLALRQAAGRYPVTLYAAKGCAPCDAGRQLLVQRGIPFAEKRVESAADTAALRRLSGALNLPLLTIGSQQLKGLVAADWQSYLDAAGYPKEPRLPSSWRNPPATSLAPATASPAAEAAVPDSPKAPEPTADPSAPKIRF